MSMSRKQAFAALVAAGLGLSAGTALAQDTLRVGHDSMPAQFGQPFGTFGANGTVPLMAIYDALTYLDADGKVTPGLALSWASKDPMTWEFKLRPNVRFHNGKPFNAETMVAVIDGLNNDPVVKLQQAAMQLRGMASARAIDDLTVEIKMAAPNPILERQFAIMRPYEPQAWKDMGPEGYGRKPIGTGAYKIDDWGKSEIKATASTDSWRPARIAKLHIIELPEIPSRVQALCSNQVDVILFLAPDNRTQVEACGKTAVFNLTPDTVNLILNIVKGGEAIKDVRVRQALNYAYDKESFIKNVLGGITKSSGQPATSALQGFQADIKAYPHDPAKARQLLSEAGYARGIKLVAEVVVDTGEFADTFSAIAADAKKVGVDLELRIITIPDLVSKIIGQKQWEGDAFSMMYEGFPTADVARPMNTHSCMFRNPHTCFPEIMPTIEAMNTEFDGQKRAALQRRVMQFYHDQATAVFSHERVQVDAVGKNVRGYSIVNRTVPWHQIEFVRN